MDAYKHLENDSFIAFKLPTPIKSRLQLIADQQGVNLSQLLRRNCIELAGLPGAERKPPIRRKKQPEPVAAGWLSFWR